ncbi:MAG: glycosyltransferase, partial [Candidatus Omnitrophica bacterium]|nr:glycosyltransferase [Candidatus Omnitrophota bacterium]MBD3268713.1 glycosyltransferase [Candidatus Omnitrophota bacterium]
ASATKHWQREIENYTIGGQEAYIMGSLSDLENPARIRKISEAKFIIVSYGALRVKWPHLRQELKGLNFDFIVVDEAHRIRNERLQTEAVREFSAEYQVLVTGTPLVGRKIVKIFNLLNWLYPERFFSRIRFASQYGKDSEGLRQLGIRLDSFTLRRMKSDVYIDFPEKRHVTHYVELRGRQKEIYERYQARLRTIVDKYQRGEKIDPQKMIVLFTALHQVALHPGLHEYDIVLESEAHSFSFYRSKGEFELKGRGYVLESGNGDRRNVVVIGPDGQEYRSHLRQAYTGDRTRVVNIEDEIFTVRVVPQESRSAKLMQLDRVIEEAVEEGRSVVIFSTYRDVVFWLRERYRQYGVYYLVGGMSANERQREIDGFQLNGDVQVWDMDDERALGKKGEIFLTTYGAGSEAITLHRACEAVLLDLPWHAQGRNQAIDRLHRLGQTEDVTAHIFVARGTIEEYMEEAVLYSDLVSQLVFEDDPTVSSADEHMIEAVLRQMQYPEDTFDAIQRYRQGALANGNSAHKPVTTALKSYDEAGRVMYIQADSRERLLEARLVATDGKQHEFSNFMSIMDFYERLSVDSQSLVSEFIRRRVHEDLIKAVPVKETVLWFLICELVPAFVDIDFHWQIERDMEIGMVILDMLFTDEGITQEDILKHIDDPIAVQKSLHFLDVNNIFKVLSLLGVLNSQFYYQAELLRYTPPLEISMLNGQVSYYEAGIVEQIAPGSLISPFDIGTIGRKKLPQARELEWPSEQRRLAREAKRGNLAARDALIYSCFPRVVIISRGVFRKLHTKFGSGAEILELEDLYQAGLTILTRSISDCYEELEERNLEEVIGGVLALEISNYGYRLISQSLRESVRLDAPAYDDDKKGETLLDRPADERLKSYGDYDSVEVDSGNGQPQREDVAVESPDSRTDLTVLAERELGQAGFTPEEIEIFFKYVAGVPVQDISREFKRSLRYIKEDVIGAAIGILRDLEDFQRLLAAHLAGQKETDTQQPSSVSDSEVFEEEAPRRSPPEPAIAGIQRFMTEEVGLSEPTVIRDLLDCFGEEELRILLSGMVSKDVVPFSVDASRPIEESRDAHVLANLTMAESLDLGNKGQEALFNQLLGRAMHLSEVYDLEGDLSLRGEVFSLSGNSLMAVSATTGKNELIIVLNSRTGKVDILELGCDKEDLRSRRLDIMRRLAFIEEAEFEAFPEGSYRLEIFPNIPSRLLHINGVPVVLRGPIGGRRNISLFDEAFEFIGVRRRRKLTSLIVLNKYNGEYWIIERGQNPGEIIIPTRGTISKNELGEGEVKLSDYLYTAPYLFAHWSELMFTGTQGYRNEVSILDQNFVIGNRYADRMRVFLTWSADEIVLYLPGKPVYHLVKCADGFYVGPEGKAISIYETASLWRHAKDKENYPVLHDLFAETEENPKKMNNFYIAVGSNRNLLIAGKDIKAVNRVWIGNEIFGVTIEVEGRQIFVRGKDQGWQIGDKFYYDPRPKDSDFRERRDIKLRDLIYCDRTVYWLFYNGDHEKFISEHKEWVGPQLIHKKLRRVLAHAGLETHRDLESAYGQLGTALQERDELQSYRRAVCVLRNINPEWELCHIDSFGTISHDYMRVDVSKYLVGVIYPYQDREGNLILVNFERGLVYKIYENSGRHRRLEESSRYHIAFEEGKRVILSHYALERGTKGDLRYPELYDFLVRRVDWSDRKVPAGVQLSSDVRLTFNKAERGMLTVLERWYLGHTLCAVLLQNDFNGEVLKFEDNSRGILINETHLIPYPDRGGVKLRNYRDSIPAVDHLLCQKSSLQETRLTSHSGGHKFKTSISSAGLEGGMYSPLTQSRIERIYDAALSVLENTGIEVKPSRCRDVWRDAGARIDEDNDRVFIPRSIIEDAISHAVPEVLLCGQESEYDMVLGEKRVYLGTGGEAVKVVNPDGAARESVLRDIFDIGRLIDCLEHIHFYQTPVEAHDVPQKLKAVNKFYAALLATQKHVMSGCSTPQEVREVVKLAEMIAGGRDELLKRPFISFAVCWVISPLRYAPETVEVLDEIVRCGLPVAISSAPQAGATSPASLAGTLVQLTAEQLSGLAYVNLLKPGHPVILGYVPSVADLRTGNFSGGAAEFAFMNAAAAQIARYIGAPIYNSAGITDSKIPDAQAGYAKGRSTLAAALAGANFIHHSAGLLESLLAVSYAQFVMDDDNNAAVLRILRGMDVNGESLALDVIDEVCKGDGHFLGHPHTFSLMRSEYYYPHTDDRSDRDSWQAKGAEDMHKRAQEAANQILQSYWPQHISKQTDNLVRERFDILLSSEITRSPYRPFESSDASPSSDTGITASSGGHLKRPQGVSASLRPKTLKVAAGSYIYDHSTVEFISNVDTDAARYLYPFDFRWSSRLNAGVYIAMIRELGYQVNLASWRANNLPQTSIGATLFSLLPNGTLIIWYIGINSYLKFKDRIASEISDLIAAIVFHADNPQYPVKAAAVEYIFITNNVAPGVFMRGNYKFLSYQGTKTSQYYPEQVRRLFYYGEKANLGRTSLPRPGSIYCVWHSEIYDVSRTEERKNFPSSQLFTEESIPMPRRFTPASTVVSKSGGHFSGTEHEVVRTRKTSLKPQLLSPLGEVYDSYVEEVFREFQGEYPDSGLDNYPYRDAVTFYRYLPSLGRHSQGRFHFDYMLLPQKEDSEVMLLGKKIAMKMIIAHENFHRRMYLIRGPPQNEWQKLKEEILATGAGIEYYFGLSPEEKKAFILFISNTFRINHVSYLTLLSCLATIDDAEQRVRRIARYIRYIDRRECEFAGVDLRTRQGLSLISEAADDIASRKFTISSSNTSLETYTPDDVSGTGDKAREVTANSGGTAIDISVVLPIYNEEGNIQRLLEEVMASLDRAESPDEGSLNYEIVCINDGSSDNSLEILENMQAKYSGRIHVIVFDANYGQAAALKAGFEFARGRYVIPMDADCQDDPEDILPMVRQLEEEELDILSGWRHDRRNSYPLLLRILIAVYKNIESVLLGVRLHDPKSTFKVYRSKFVKGLDLTYAGAHRFIIAIILSTFGDEDVKIGEMIINNRQRNAGVTKYSYGKKLRNVLRDVRATSGFRKAPRGDVVTEGEFGLERIVTTSSVTRAQLQSTVTVKERRGEKKYFSIPEPVSQAEEFATVLDELYVYSDLIPAGLLHKAMTPQELSSFQTNRERFQLTHPGIALGIGDRHVSPGVIVILDRMDEMEDFAFAYFTAKALSSLDIESQVSALSRVPAVYEIVKTLSEFINNEKASFYMLVTLNILFREENPARFSRIYGRITNRSRDSEEYYSHHLQRLKRLAPQFAIREVNEPTNYTVFCYLLYYRNLKWLAYEYYRPYLRSLSSRFGFSQGDYLGCMVNINEPLFVEKRLTDILKGKAELPSSLSHTEAVERLGSEVLRNTGFLIAELQADGGRLISLYSDEIAQAIACLFYPRLVNAAIAKNNGVTDSAERERLEESLIKVEDLIRGKQERLESLGDRDAPGQRQRLESSLAGLKRGREGILASLEELSADEGKSKEIAREDEKKIRRILSGLNYDRSSFRSLPADNGETLDVCLLSRSMDWLEIGRYFGDCISPQVYPSQTNNVFWTVPTWLLNLGNQIAVVKRNGVPVCKVHYGLYVHRGGLVPLIEDIDFPSANARLDPQTRKHVTSFESRRKYFAAANPVLQKAGQRLGEGQVLRYSYLKYKFRKNPRIIIERCLPSWISDIVLSMGEKLFFLLDRLRTGERIISLFITDPAREAVRESTGITTEPRLLFHYGSSLFTNRSSILSALGEDGLDWRNSDLYTLMGSFYSWVSSVTYGVLSGKDSSFNEKLEAALLSANQSDCRTLLEAEGLESFRRRVVDEAGVSPEKAQRVVSLFTESLSMPTSLSTFEIKTAASPVESDIKTGLAILKGVILSRPLELV